MKPSGLWRSRNKKPGQPGFACHSETTSQEVVFYCSAQAYYWSAAGPQPPIIFEIEIAG
ncbi:hypothetical protein ESA_04359 [Cronobacter sakazakii ATCC BAA-894]|uniref:Uncharacterized protein n=1 Tax=Cronobacter sakazakii (strain ATCC BAA-894) TaxID=290339 RepID=A7ME39_CROS8|nr:hypothetical protein ESA_04359 [Cronobacter sakazakii ATCC BAA-894]